MVIIRRPHQPGSPGPGSCPPLTDRRRKANLRNCPSAHGEQGRVPPNRLFRSTDVAERSITPRGIGSDWIYSKAEISMPKVAVGEIVGLVRTGSCICQGVRRRNAGPVGVEDRYQRLVHGFTPAAPALLAMLTSNYIRKTMPIGVKPTPIPLVLKPLPRGRPFARMALAPAAIHLIRSSSPDS